MTIKTFFRYPCPQPPFLLILIVVQVVFMKTGKGKVIRFIKKHGRGGVQALSWLPVLNASRTVPK